MARKCQQLTVDLDRMGYSPSTVSAMRAFVPKVGIRLAFKHKPESVHLQSDNAFLLPRGRMLSPCLAAQPNGYWPTEMRHRCNARKADTTKEFVQMDLQ